MYLFPTAPLSSISFEPYSLTDPKFILVIYLLFSWYRVILLYYIAQYSLSLYNNINSGKGLGKLSPPYASNNHVAVLESFRLICVLRHFPAHEDSLYIFPNSWIRLKVSNLMILLGLTIRTHFSHPQYFSLVV